MKSTFFISILFVFVSCQEKVSKKLPHGHWLGEFEIGDHRTIPFNFEVVNDSVWKIANADEEIVVDEISYKNDSIFIKMPVYETYFAVALNTNRLAGYFIDPTMERKVPFRAAFDVSDRFKIENSSSADMSGAWEVEFQPETAASAYPALGVFEQRGNRVTGTFRTSLGDYRYLEGVVDGNEFKLSTFDGARAFLFVGEIKGDQLNGIFYSGNHWKERFIGVRNENFELPDASALTMLKNAVAAFDFSFPNAQGQMITMADKEFKNKVVVVQLMGSWCANCLDESAYFSEYAYRHTNKDVAFVALAFEYAKTEALAFEAIKRLKDRLGIDYPILLAQYGTASKSEAHEKLPMLNEVISYPTTIIIDKQGEVRKILTGFNGPATGQAYLDFKSEFEGLINKLMAE